MCQKHSNNHWNCKASSSCSQKLWASYVLIVLWDADQSTSQWPHQDSCLHEKCPTAETWNSKAPSKDVVCTFSLIIQSMIYLKSGETFLFLGTYFVACKKKGTWFQHPHQETIKTFLWLSYYIHSGIEYRNKFSTHLEFSWTYGSFSAEQLTLFCERIGSNTLSSKILSKICAGFWLENVWTTSAFLSLAPSVLFILQQGVIFFISIQSVIIVFF